MWYSPTIVGRVVDRITGDLKKLDPADAGYFDQRAASFTSTALKRYNDLRASIKAKYSGVPVGATESIFVDLARNLGLNLITPPDYMKAISEGNDPTAADKSTVDAQISGRRIRILVFNKQNSTTDIQRLVDTARSDGIPVVAITETLDPATASFQDWQAGQLDSLQMALARATGR
jgi:zinc/manganese transport system substrate-binding protein